MTKNRAGKVYLVGAGPGDPGLLTLKAKECLSRADVVIYDHLANRIFLTYANEKAERVYVGKKGGSHTLAQEKINRLIVDYALQGKAVVRLKGGDPFIFGRGGEEALALREAGLTFEVVPGVTSAIAVPAYAGIPLTHRDLTSTVAFVTGHEDPQKVESSISWEKLATGVGTIVFLMGVGNLQKITERLMEHGRPSETPVAVIQDGTGPGQKTLIGTLGNIAEIAQQATLRPPAVIVVGEVVRLREKLGWFETRPLFGRRIVITRAREQASRFMEKLASLGAECIEFPTIQIESPESWDLLDEAIQHLETYQWLVFTSINGVKHFLSRLETLGKDVRDLKGKGIAAIGPKTAEGLARIGIRPEIVPGEYRAEAVVDCLRSWDLAGSRVLLPRAAQAREILPERLREMGAYVQVVPAYRTVRPDRDKERIWRMLEKRSIDMVTFTSSSTVSNFVGMFEGEGPALLRWMKEVAVACIGPVTAKTAEEKGLRVHVVPSEYTIESLTQSIVDFFEAGVALRTEGSKNENEAEHLREMEKKHGGCD